jgi:hypothetical protein
VGVSIEGSLDFVIFSDKKVTASFRPGSPDFPLKVAALE